MRIQFKFNPSLKRELAPGDRRLWLLRSVALRIELQSNPLWVFEVFHRRLLVALGVLAVAGYLLAATGLYYWLNRQPHNQVGWFDLAAPWHWKELRPKRGDAAVLTGLDLLKQGNYTDGFYQLRVGLARSPGNVEGRLTLVRLLYGQDPNRALELMEEGLTYTPDNPQMLAALFDLYALLQAQERALQTAEARLKASPAEPARALLQRTRLQLLVQTGRLDEAEAGFAALPAPADPAEQLVLRSMQMDLKHRMGRMEEAGRLLDELLAEKTLTPAVLRLCGETAITLGKADAFQAIVRRLRAADPDAPGPLLLAIQGWQRLKRASLRSAAEQEYFQFFRTNDGALQALAALGVNLGEPDLVLRARQAAVRARLSQFAYGVHLTELALRRNDAEAATRSLRDWEKDVDTLKPAQRFYPEFIRRLTRAAFAGTSDHFSALQSLLEGNRYQARLPIFDFAIGVMEKAGHVEAAAQLARTGLRYYPYSTPLVATGKRIDARLATLVKTTERESPAAPVVSVAATPAEALQEIDAAIAADRLAAARDYLRAIRTQKPQWLASSEAELALRDVELACLSVDPIAARTAARGFLDRHRSEADLLKLAALVERLAQGGHPDEARRLQDEMSASAGLPTAVRLALKKQALPEAAADPSASRVTALAELDRCIVADDWTAADRLLRRLRDQPPAWLAEAAVEVKSREVLVRLGADQRPLALAALKELVVKGGAARSAAFKLVRDQLAQRKPETALLLAKEIARLLPGDAAAARLVKEAEAPPPAE